MRKIKFRVWCEFEINGELHKYMESPASWFLLTQTGKLWSYGPTSAPQPIEKEYKKAIPLFYTGLKDKNGKEIYEGDVVVGYHDGSNYKSKVWWDDCGFTVDVGHGYHPYLGEVNHTELEIFGNIYENPDIVV